ncbi:MAG: acyl-CoA dehydrogenase family protein [Dehalococcoidia bacterium]|nr:MAG: acyl-CoA dehydrogenase family protein [Dehalococcoidia bacterium]
MDFRFTAEEEAFRQEVREFIRREMPPDWEGVFLEEEEEDWKQGRAFVKKLSQKGWVAPAWPKEYGGMEASPALQLVYNEEMGYHRAPIGSIIQAVGYIGPAILFFGTEEQKNQHLPPITAGEIVWCQGFSEPEAGSDLASLKCRAVKDGDDWVINGDKIWTSNAHRSEWCILLARTDPAAPKHKGISFFLVDMQTPGITVQPTINMANVHSFNQVFFEDVRVPSSALLGQENQGWYIAAMTLDYERSSLVAAAVSMAKRGLDDLVEYCKETKVNGRSLLDNPLVRHKLSEMAIEIEVGKYMVYRVVSQQARKEPGSIEAAVCKLYNTEMDVRLANTGIQILGLYGQLHKDSKWVRMMGRFQKSYLYAIAMVIGGGSSEIQRNIIAMRGLGLPRG